MADRHTEHSGTGSQVSRGPGCSLHRQGPLGLGRFRPTQTTRALWVLSPGLFTFWFYLFDSSGAQSLAPLWGSPTQYPFLTLAPPPPRLSLALHPPCMATQGSQFMSLPAVGPNSNLFVFNNCCSIWERAMEVQTTYNRPPCPRALIQ